MKSLFSMLLPAVLVIGGLAFPGPELRAQSELGKVREIVRERGWTPASMPAGADYRLVQGWVLDAFDYQALGGASVSLVRGDKHLFWASTDAEGYFYFQLPPDLEFFEQMQIVVSYGGVSSVKQPIVLEEDAMVVLAEVDVVLKPVLLLSDKWPDRGGCPGPPYSLRVLRPWATDAVLYRPLDEWLMMHSSEIHHNGRW